MAAAFLSTANTFLSSPSPSPLLSSSSSSSATTLVYLNKHNAKRQLTVCCKAVTESVVLSRRGLAISFITTSSVLLLTGKSDAAILEADDDEELLERVKRDRKKRIERQGVISASNKETVLLDDATQLQIPFGHAAGYLQDLVYKLSKIGQAIDNNDLSTAGSVLGGSTDTDWVQKANLAFTKLSSSPEEKTQVDTFNSSLASLISSVTQKDIEASKVAFVASASAFEKWTALSGLGGQLKGL